MSWIKKGETYKVELLSGGGNCGAGLDLAEGDVLSMKAVDSVPMAGCGDCDLVRTSVDVPGVKPVGPADFAPQKGFGIRFGETLAVQIGQDCTGTYTIGLAGTLNHFSSTPVSDITLWRNFETVDPTKCLAPGSGLLMDGRNCTDSWLVRVTDSSGKVVSKDLPVSTKEAQP